MADYFVGLDLAQVQDYSAIAVVGLDDTYLEASRARSDAYDRLDAIRDSPLFDEVDLRAAEREVEAKLESLPEPVYEVRHLERLPLGTSYPEVVGRVMTLLETPPLKDNTELAVDATGVGTAVVDMLTRTGLHFKGVTITSGEEEVREGNAYRVPKRDLIASAQVLLQFKRLKIAPNLPEAKSLIQELLNFRYDITRHANDTYGTWRKDTHDDLVLAAALAVWAAERRSPPTNESLVNTTALPFRPFRSRRPF